MLLGKICLTGDFVVTLAAKMLTYVKSAPLFATSQALKFLAHNPLLGNDNNPRGQKTAGILFA